MSESATLVPLQADQGIFSHFAVSIASCRRFLNTLTMLTACYYACIFIAAVVGGLPALLAPKFPPRTNNKLSSLTAYSYPHAHHPHPGDPTPIYYSPRSSSVWYYFWHYCLIIFHPLVYPAALRARLASTEEIFGNQTRLPAPPHSSQVY
jgi:hypothetical protein